MTGPETARGDGGELCELRGGLFGRVEGEGKRGENAFGLAPFVGGVCTSEMWSASATTCAAEAKEVGAREAWGRCAHRDACDPRSARAM